MSLTRETALSIVSHCLDDSLSPRSVESIPDDATIVVFDKEARPGVPMVVAVWSYLPGCRIDADEAGEMAADYLNEIHWPHAHDGAVQSVFVAESAERPRM